MPRPSKQHREICHKLVALLEMTQGFELVFLQIAPELQPALEAYAKQHTRVRQWLTIRFTQPIDNLADELRARHLTLDAQTVLSISGLEHSITDAQQPAKLVAQLNLTRDLLPEQFPCPCLFWLPFHATQNFARFAQDIWSWRAGVFYFDAPVSTAANEIEFLEVRTRTFDPQTASEREFQQQIDNLLRLVRHHAKIRQDSDLIASYIRRIEELLPQVKPIPRAGYYSKIGEIYGQQGQQEIAQYYIDVATHIVESQEVQRPEQHAEVPRHIYQALRQQIIEFLISLPNLDDANARRAFIFRAGLDPMLQMQLNVDGSLAHFATLLVHTLISYGRLRDGRHALVALLETAKDFVGAERRAYGDLLIREVKKELNV